MVIPFLVFLGPVWLWASLVVLEVLQVLEERIVGELSIVSDEFLEGDLEATGAVIGRALLLLGLEVVVVLGIAALESLRS